MKLDTAADFDTLLKVLRKHGVEIIKIDNIEIVLGKEPQKQPSERKSRSASKSSFGEIDENIKIPITPLTIPTDELTEEQVLFGSSDPSVWADGNNQ
jgi:hypothetical protein